MSLVMVEEPAEILLLAHDTAYLANLEVSKNISSPPA
jgi:hypothetical protein